MLLGLLQAAVHTMSRFFVARIMRNGQAERNQQKDWKQRCTDWCFDLRKISSLTKNIHGRLALSQMVPDSLVSWALGDERIISGASATDSILTKLECYS